MRWFVGILFFVGLCAFGSVDFHHHFSDHAILFPVPRGKDIASIIEIQNKANLDKSFLISDSYRYPEEFIGDKRYELDMELSFKIQNQSERFAGVCGVNINWSDSKEIVNRCLELPGMVGVKMHFSHEKLFLSDEATYFELVEFLNSLPAKKIFFLIHFEFDLIDPISKEKQVNRLFEIASLFQHFNFIIAHAAEDQSEVLNSLGKLFSINPDLRRNLYTEISTIFSIANFYENKKEQVINDWRAFGIEYILFGSDYPLYHPKDTLEQLYNSILTKTEKQKIAKENARQFLKWLSF